MTFKTGIIFILRLKILLPSYVYDAGERRTRKPVKQVRSVPRSHAKVLFREIGGGRGDKARNRDGDRDKLNMKIEMDIETGGR